jgi:glutaredoxin
MSRIAAGAAALLTLTAAASCQHGTTTAAGTADAGSGSSLPVVRVIPGEDHYLLSWYDSDGKMHDVSRLADVPAEARRQILVRDLARTPAELQADRYLYLADLSGSAPSDGYPTAVVSRYSFEAQDDPNLPALGTESTLPDGGSSSVIVYGTSWCGACKAARDHFHARHIPFVDRDVEKEPAAAAELARKAKAAGLHVGGVPVLDVHGHLLMGFDASTVDRLLSQR